MKQHWQWVVGLLQKKDGLALTLFRYVGLIVFSILLLQTLAEKALIQAMMHVPDTFKEEVQDLAYQAAVLTEEGDMDELADWENAQPYKLFVVDPDNEPLTHREMHPYFEYKMGLKRDLDAPMEARLSKPLFGVQMVDGNQLIVQMPRDVNPFNQFMVYLTIINITITVVMLGLFAHIVARKLQEPLDRLREASHKLAKGDFNVNVVKELRSNTLEFNQLAEDFDLMAVEIHTLAEKQRRLLRDVSHELRTPLARQNLALYLLRNRVAPEGQEALDRVAEQGKEMELLIDEILHYSQLEHAQYTLKLQPLSAEALLNQKVERIRQDLKPGQQLSLLTPITQVMLLADHKLLLRCLANLIGNAIKYAGEHAVITVHAKALTYGQQGWVEIAVSDDGIGIPTERLNTIFHPFTRLEASRNKQAGGYGLGLAIVKESMRLMNGKVIAENQPGGGLTVRLLLPVAEK